MENAIYRQGDVLLRRVLALPESLKPVPRQKGRVVLAEGEVTGHAHTIEAGAQLLAGKDLEERFLQVLAEGGVELMHQEHETITLPPGDYRVIRQREYIPAEIRRAPTRIRRAPIESRRVAD